MKDYFTKAYFIENKERVIKGAAVTVIVIVAIFVFFFKTGHEEQVTVEAAADQIVSAEEQVKVVIADVSGAVKTPKVVELKDGSRVGDAIESAGGLTENADISQVNRAAVVSDGEKIYIPTFEQVAAGEYSPVNSDMPKAKVNINTADSAQLQTISGIGPSTAEKIISYRKTNGNFSKIEDLKNVDGIGEKTFEKIKDRLIV